MHFRAHAPLQYIIVDVSYQTSDFVRDGNWTSCNDTDLRGIQAKEYNVCIHSGDHGGTVAKWFVSDVWGRLVAHVEISTPLDTPED